MNCPIAIPDSYNYLFENRQDKQFAEWLIGYVIADYKIPITPNIWQDVEIYIRYQKRDVWSLEDYRLDNAIDAIIAYRFKYITEHLKKSEIIKIFQKLFSQKNNGKDNKTLLTLFAEKFHAPVDDLFMVQEKNIITKDQVSDLAEIFAYPGWIEFSDDALDAIFDQILHDQLSDEMINYVFGASDTMKDYHKWYEVAKHVLATTNNSRTFWTAGDIINIVWLAAPDDPKIAQWFRDEIFQIFWPRVGSVWPILHQEDINFDRDESTRILRDSIGWLESLTDLKDRLPELGDDYHLPEHPDAEDEFTDLRESILDNIELENDSVENIMKKFFRLVDLVRDDESLESLQTLAQDNLMPLLKKSKSEIDYDKTISLAKGAVKHAETTLKDQKREEKNITRMVKTKK